MNSCCVNPLELIAGDKHRVGEECCLNTEVTPAPGQAGCPVSKRSSRKVQKRTLEHLLRPEKVGSVQNVQYYYCADPSCNVVYFSNENVPFFTVDDVAVKVLSKETGNDVNVCYCFNWTRSRINEEIITSGQSTASLQIAKEVKAGNCACDIKNPKGECCLGDVNQVIKETMRTLKPGA